MLPRHTSMMCAPSVLTAWQVMLPNISFLGHLCGLLIGCVYAHGGLQWCMPSVRRLKQLEASACLACVVAQPNYVPVPEAAVNFRVHASVWQRCRAARATVLRVLGQSFSSASRSVLPVVAQPEQVDAPEEGTRAINLSQPDPWSSHRHGLSVASVVRPPSQIADAALAPDKIPRIPPPPGTATTHAQSANGGTPAARQPMHASEVSRSLAACYTPMLPSPFCFQNPLLRFPGVWCCM